MTNIEELRDIIGEPDETTFTDVTLQYYLTKYKTLENTAAFIWGIKVAKIQKRQEAMKITKSTVGSETFEMRSLDGELKAAMDQRDYWNNQVTNGVSSPPMQVFAPYRPNIFTRG
jgi:hypothetical protein